MTVHCAPIPLTARRVSVVTVVLVAALRHAGRRMPINDSWIAATALAHGLEVATQDDDYDGVPGLGVLKL